MLTSFAGSSLSYSTFSVLRRFKISRMLLKVFVLGWFVTTCGATDYRVVVKTSDKLLAGTDGTVYLSITGSNGTLSMQELSIGKDHLERYRLDDYTFTSPSSIGVICKVDLEKTSGNGWRVNFVSVKDMDTGKEVIFSYYEWIYTGVYTRQRQVYGAWGAWGPWGSCDGSCGGHNRRYRKCDDPVPACGGSKCHGEDTDVVACPVDDCTVVTVHLNTTTSPLNTSTPTVNNTTPIVQPIRNKPSLSLLLGASLGAVALIAIIVVVCVCYICRKRNRQISRSYTGRSSPDIVHTDHIYQETMFTHGVYSDDNLQNETKVNNKTPINRVNGFVGRQPSHPLSESEYYNDDIALNGAVSSDGARKSTYYENMASPEPKQKTVSLAHTDYSIPSSTENDTLYAYMSPGNELKTGEDNKSSQLPDSKGDNVSSLLQDSGHYSYSDLFPSPVESTTPPKSTPVAHYHDMTGSKNISNC